MRMQAVKIEEGTVTVAKALEIDFETQSSHKWVSTGGKPGRISGAEQEPALFMYPSLSTPTSDSEWCPIFISDLRWTSSDLSVIASQMELIPQYKSDSDAALEASDGPDLRAASARLIIFKSVCRKSAVRRQAREMCRIRSRPSVSTCYMQETEVHS
ncbi:uncharacterized [Tachysurus ichikawai]